MIHCAHIKKEFVSTHEDSSLCWHLDELDINKGERVLITGPSGCGKTTLLNLLSGLLQPDAGDIVVDGIHVDQLSTSEADIFRGQHIGLIFQSFHLLMPLTIMENILLGARYGRKWSTGEAYEKADHLLSMVGLAKYRSCRPGQLSIGEQQRVAIARALINEPPLLLADEPTASLDTANSQKVLDLLFTLCDEQQATLVVVSHDTDIMERFPKRIDATPWMATSRQELSYV